MIGDIATTIFVIQKHFIVQKKNHLHTEKYSMFFNKLIIILNSLFYLVFKKIIIFNQLFFFLSKVRMGEECDNELILRIFF